MHFIKGSALTSNLGYYHFLALVVLSLLHLDCSFATSLQFCNIIAVLYSCFTFFFGFDVLIYFLIVFIYVSPLGRENLTLYCVVKILKFVNLVKSCIYKL